MDRSDTIKLISRTYTQNSMGVSVATETNKTVFCRVDSVSRSEFFEGGRNGLNPQYSFGMFKYDYNGENVVEYNSKRYTVYRTYEDKKTETVYLYAELKKGNG